MTARSSAYPVLAVFAAILAAIFTPTPDAMSTVVAWLITTAVILVLYEAGRFVYLRFFGWRG